METDDHLLMFEVERHRPFTRMEAKGALVGSMAGFLSGSIIELSPDSPSSRSSQDVDQGVPPYMMPVAQTTRPLAKALQPEPPKYSSDQLVHVAEITGLTAVAAFAIVAAARLFKYKRKVNFRSDIDADDLRNWYNSADAPVDS